ncbi:MAG: TIGR04463 family radical SAM/SPASM RiPP maturase [Kofleriaceae bacterium]
MELAPSRYNIPIPLLDGGSLIYNSAYQSFTRLTAEENRWISGLADGTQSELPEQFIEDARKQGLLVAKDFDELAALKRHYDAHRFNEAEMVLTVAPTMACNFGCDYCFQGQDKAKETMSMAVQDALVDYVERECEKGVKSIGIAWYGGEPLLRLNVIEALSDRLMAVADQNNVKYHGMCVTNAFKLDLKAAKLLHSKKVNWIQVTLDGTPEYHDTRRYLLGGGGSFDRIIGNLQSIVDEVPISFVIRVNIDSRNQRDIKKLIDFMAEAGLGHRSNLAMYFAPVEAMTEGCHSVSDVTMTKGMYGALEADLWQYGYRAGLCTLPNPPRFHGVCGAIKPQGLVVVPTGDIHKCWDTVSWPEKRAGTIFDIEQFKSSEIHQTWMKWTPFENNSCRNCKILPNCSGACAFKFVYPDETRGEAATLPCPSWKYNIKERLLWKAVALGKVKPEEYDPKAVATVPSELCTDDAVTGGKDLPASIAAHYEKQKRYLPVVRGS